jgi:uncharacterized protein YbaA (DUF1428 family)
VGAHAGAHVDPGGTAQRDDAAVSFAGDLDLAVHIAERLEAVHFTAPPSWRCLCRLRSPPPWARALLHKKFFVECRFAPPPFDWLTGQTVRSIQPQEIDMNYIDGFVAAVPTANRQKYREHAEKAAAVFKDHGALAVVECWGDDVPEGKLTSFPLAVKREANETVVFSWVTWPSRQVRDAAWEKVMADPRMKPETNPMPFDGKRLIYGGFEQIVNV